MILECSITKPRFTLFAIHFFSPPVLNNIYIYTHISRKYLLETRLRGGTQEKRSEEKYPSLSLPPSLSPAQLDRRGTRNEKEEGGGGTRLKAAAEWLGSDRGETER